MARSTDTYIPIVPPKEMHRHMPLFQRQVPFSLAVAVRAVLFSCPKITSWALVMIPGVRLVRASGALSRLILACILSATALADDTPAQPQTLQYPLAVACGDNDRIYIADRLLPGVWTYSNGALKLLAQGEKRFRTPLNAVRAVAVGVDNAVYVGASATREIYRLEENQPPTPLTSGSIGIPVDIAVDSKGSLFVSDLESQRIWKISPDGSPPQELVQLAAPRGLFFDSSDTLWAIAASGDQPLVKILADGSVTPVVKSRAFEFPHDVVIAADGRAFVSDNYAGCIWQVTPNGQVEPFVRDTPLVGPVGLSLKDNSLIVADPKANAIFSVDLTAESSPTVTRLIGSP